MDNFEKAVDYVLTNEGGYVNNPHDPGGATNMGITHSTLAHYLGTPVTDDDVKRMSKATACAIYRKGYWDPIKADLINDAGIATCIFDSGVLYGPATASIYAQHALNNLGNDLTVDGVIGLHTIAAFNHADPKSFIQAFHDLIIQRILHIVANNPSQVIFERGWRARADRLLTLS